MPGRRGGQLFEANRMSFGFVMQCWGGVLQPVGPTVLRSVPREDVIEWKGSGLIVD